MKMFDSMNVTKKYNDIMMCKTMKEVMEQRDELEKMIKESNDFDPIQMITLQNTLHLKVNQLSIGDLAEQLIMMSLNSLKESIMSKSSSDGEFDNVMNQLLGMFESLDPDFDPEKEHLEELQDREAEEVKKGKITNIADFVKKEDDK